MADSGAIARRSERPRPRAAALATTAPLRAAPGSKRWKRWCPLLIGLAGCSSPVVDDSDAALDRHAAASVPLARSMALPRRVGFESNQGQWPSAVRYLARDGEAALFLTATEAVWRGRGTPADEPRRASWTRMRWVGADPSPAISGGNRQETYVNYIRGRDAARWRSRVPVFARVVYRDLYPGIDLVFHDEGGALEYDFVVHPGGDPGAIRLRIEGAEDPRHGPTGDLTIDVATGAFTHRRPIAYQNVTGGRAEVSASYSVRPAGDRAVDVQFTVAEYDRTQPLVIDPSVSYATVIDPKITDDVVDVAVDAGGNLWLVGMTQNLEFPVTDDAIDAEKAQFDDGYVVEIDPTGRVVYATYLGGTLFNCVGGLSLDHDGNVFVAGTTISKDFPVTLDALQGTLDGEGGDGFLVKLDTAGQLLYSTYVGGTGSETCGGRGERWSGVAVAPDGAIYYLLSATTSLELRMIPGAVRQNLDSDMLLIRFDSALRPQWGRFLGATTSDRALRVRTDGQSNAYVLGSTYHVLGMALDFPTTPGAFQETTQNDTVDYVAKYGPDGTLLYATLFGAATGNDGGVGGNFDVDAAGNAYIAVVAGTNGMPVTPGAYQSQLRGFTDVFIGKLDPTGAHLLYGTYLGGSNAEQNSSEGVAIAVNEAGNVYVGASTFSGDFPLRSPFQEHPREDFIAKLTPDGHDLVYASYLDLGAHAFAVANGAAYVGGRNPGGPGIGAMKIADAATPPPCTGDCDGNGRVLINELILGVRIALNLDMVGVCSRMDRDGNGRVVVAELIAAVGKLLTGCR